MGKGKQSGEVPGLAFTLALGHGELTLIGLLQRARCLLVYKTRQRVGRVSCGGLCNDLTLKLAGYFATHIHWQAREGGFIDSPSKIFETVKI